MLKINFFLKNFFLIKNYYSGISLNSNEITNIKNNNFNLLNCNVIIKKSIFLIYKKIFFNLLLNKKEILEIIFFKKKKYKCIPVEIFKIKSLFKIKISIIKKKGDARF